MDRFSLNIRGNLLTYERPLVMGILNHTPDSFYAGSRVADASAARRRVEQMIAEGADMIDVGAYSSRSGASDVSAEEEIRRLSDALAAVRQVDSSVPVSVDTFRADVAEEAVTGMGADIVNDISGGDLDGRMFETVARLHVPYILMHMRGTPATMQQLTDYDSEGGVAAAVIAGLADRIKRLELLGVADIVVDPGFGFSKTLGQNYALLASLSAIRQILGRPVLAGLSRKSMLTRALGITADEALNATTVANTLALQQGAAILRVHDVAAARQAVEIYSLYSAQGSATIC